MKLLKTSWFLVFFIGISLQACAPSPRAPLPKMSEQAWQEAQKELIALRQTHEPKTGVMRVNVHFTAGTMEIRGRGAIARRPPNRLRMILLGPGGMTAFDLLVRDDQFRLQVPAKDRVWQGNVQDTSKEFRGLPIAFLRWWLLDPLSGKLLFAQAREEGKVFVLRQEDATLRVQQRADGLRMDRKSQGGTERMVVAGPGCADAIYEHVQSNVRVRVTCEGWVRDTVEDRVFE